MPSVSVVVPVYNVERYLAECLDSLLGQTLKDVEIICVNDGSTDRSREILADYAVRDSRITVVDQENGGLSAARNVGARLAQGEYLYFLDSDDFLETDALEILHNRAAADDLDVVYFNATPFFESEQVQADHLGYKTYYNRNADYPGVMTGQELLVAMHRHNDWKPSVVLQFMRTIYYRESDLSFYEGIVHEDNLFSFLNAMQAQRVGYVDRHFFHRRVREDSIMTATKGAANVKGYYLTYVEMLRFIAGKSYADEVSRVVARMAVHMQQSALHLLCDLAKDERDAIVSMDSRPDAICAATILNRRCDEQRRAKQLKKSLDEAEKKLKKITNSRSYKLARKVGRVLGRLKRRER